MSDFFWKKLSEIFGLLTILAIFGLLVFVANLEIKDLDLWLHIGMGRHIVQSGFQVPPVDVLSCTIPGKPWVNHEWLFQVVVYYIYTWWGADGLITMQVILVSLTLMILLFLGYNREKQLGSIFILLLVSLVYHQRFTIRPDLYSLLFFALYILIMSFFLDRRWSIYAIFLVQVLWTNMHGFFFFGPLFALIGVAAEWGKRHLKLPFEWNKVGRLNNEEYRRLKIILLLVVLACFLNPMGIQGAWYPIGVFFQLSGESKIFFDKIIELKRPIALNTFLDFNQEPYYKLLIILSAISFVFNRRYLDIGIFAFWLIFLLFSLSAIRNLIYFAFAAYLVFVTNAINISLKNIIPIRITDRKFVALVSIFLKLTLIMWVVQYGVNIAGNGYFDFDKYERKSEFGGITQRNYPDKAVNFLVQNKIKGNFFNDFNSGAYMVGHCYPNIKVFIDGRTEVYGPAFFKYYQRVWEQDNVEEFANALENYKITGALMNSVHQPVPRGVLTYLYKNPAWVPVYFNYDAVIFLKDVPENKAYIEKFRLDLGTPRVEDFDLLRLGARNVTPYQHINRAYTLETLGLDDAALREIEEVLKIAPNYREAYKVLGKIYAKRKDYRRAFENFRIATMFAPDDHSSRMNLALAYYDLGEYKYAIEQYQRMIERWPSNPKAYFFLARAYVKNKQYKEVVEVLNQVRKVVPDDVVDLVKIGDMLFTEKEFNAAREVYELAGQTGKEPALIHTKMGLTFNALGELSRAEEELEKARQNNPDNREVAEILRGLNGVLREGPALAE